MDYNLIIQLAMGAGTILSVFVIVKQKVQQHDETFKIMHLELKESFKKRDDEAKEDYAKLDKRIDGEYSKLDKKLETCFKKYDEANKVLTEFEKALDKKVTLKEVTEEFITRKELDLRLQLIESTTTNTNREVAKMEKQLEEVLNILQNKGK